MKRDPVLQSLIPPQETWTKAVETIVVDQVSASAMGSLRLSTAPPVAERPSRVLIVDAEPARRKRILKLLKAEGYQAMGLGDASEVFRLDAEFEPDLLILAAEMPGVSGVELCGELKAQAANPHPILLLGNAETDEQTIASGLLAGADDYVADVERIVELRARIRVQLRHKRHLDALQRVRHERDNLRRDAHTDPLTGLLNRRSLESSVFNRWEKRERFGVVFVDVDHFKSVNDRFGHDMGDRVLRVIADQLRGCTRPGDVLGRYGGEEFVALISGAGPESVRLVAERLRVAVERMPPTTNGPDRVTISLGAAVFDPREPNAALSPEALLRQADEALYAAKHGGRNRTVVFCAPDDDEDDLRAPRPFFVAPPAPMIRERPRDGEDQE